METGLELTLPAQSICKTDIFKKAIMPKILYQNLSSYLYRNDIALFNSNCFNAKLNRELKVALYQLEMCSWKGMTNGNATVPSVGDCGWLALIGQLENFVSIKMLLIRLKCSFRLASTCAATNMDY